MQRCNSPHGVSAMCFRAPCDRPPCLLQIKWNVWSFDEGLASRVPYESAARTLTQHKRSMAAFTTRQGLAITMEVRRQPCPGSNRSSLSTRLGHSHRVCKSAPRAHHASSSAAQLHDVRRGPGELPAAAQADRGKHPVSPRTVLRAESARRVRPDPARCAAGTRTTSTCTWYTPFPPPGRGRISDRARQWDEGAVHVAPSLRRRRRRSLCPPLGS